MEKKQIAIIGAGLSGLVACKYCLAKGFNPIVFEFESDVGGVWTKTIKTTQLQLPKVVYQYSDFPWPDSVSPFPNQPEVHEYLRSYAAHFNLRPYIKFHSRVKGIDYDGPSSDTWSLWNGNGEAFPPEGKWHVTVEDTQTANMQVYTVDFVIVCLGRFKDVPYIPKFPAGKGPEVFRGQVIHSKDYAAMPHDKAEELVKGKKVVVVGFGKTGLDIARECATANGPEYPCTVLYRRDHWKVGDWKVWGGVRLTTVLLYFIFIRFSELLVHKPGEGFLLSLLATLLSPIRWAIWKFIEFYAKSTLPLAKYDMLPEYTVLQDVNAGLLMHLPNPEKFFDDIDKGSLKLKKSHTYSFYEKGLIAEKDNTHIEADLVIFATGFDGVGKLKAIFQSPKFGSYIADTPRVSLYKETIHPRIPQLGVIGYTESFSSIYTSEMRSRWLVALLEGAFKLPNIKEMEKDIKRWDEYIKQASGEEFQHISAICGLEIWYNDQLCKDMGVNPMRKKGLIANLFEPYGPTDYTEI